MTGTAAGKPRDPSDQPVTALPGVGPALAEKLEKLGISRLGDLLFHLPARYEDRTRVTPIGSLRPGRRAVIEGEVALTEVTFGKRRSLLSRVFDGSGSITLRFFHFSKRQQAGLARGVKVRCFGEARPGPKGLEMVHPEYRVFREGAPPPLDATLTPIYPVTEGVTPGRMRALVDRALDRALDKRKDRLTDLLPETITDRYQLPGLDEAIEYLHRPPRDADLGELELGRHPAQRRLAFEELLAHHLSLRKHREAKRHEPGMALDAASELRARYLDALPFELTAAQSRVIQEMDRDLDQATPMMRLIQGDVGSGKTVVAAAAMLRAVASGAQAAFMAPTELLAEQHLATIKDWLEPLGIQVVWLSGRQKAKERREAMALIADGVAPVVVGTHALFQEEVQFKRLALVVVDEQHRFGVHQRLALREKGRGSGEHLPHQLIMTATPIPRTLAQTAYADLDVSVIDELPPGRTPVTTVAIPESRRAEVVQRIADACAGGRQAYWVCPLVEESEQLEAQAAEATAEQLQQALPDLRIGLVHGRMKPEQKDTTMRAFKAGEADLLVATTVIEVGVDVPAASLMVIENAERMGLAQLHQLRGRVGRGDQASSCVLLYKPPLSEHARQRLAALRETTDGFAIARKDLELRGPGELLGTRQTGLMNLKVADLARDGDLLPEIHTAAEELIREPAIIDALIRRWIGEAGRYAQV